MKKILISSCIAASALFTTNVKAQTVIDGKHWYKIASKDGKVTIPEHCVITYIGADVEGARGNENITVGDLTYRFTLFPGSPVRANYTFTGEMYTGDQKLEIRIENAKNETIIAASYYN